MQIRGERSEQGWRWSRGHSGQRSGNRGTGLGWRQPGAGAALEGGQEGHKRLSAYDQRG